METEDPQELAAMRLMWTYQSPAVRATWRGFATAPDDRCPTCGATSSEPCTMQGSQDRMVLLRYHPARINLVNGTAA